MIPIENSFPEFSQNGDNCPICKTKANTETILIELPGQGDVYTVEAKQAHKECVELFNKMHQIEQDDKGKV